MIFAAVLAAFVLPLAVHAPQADSLRDTARPDLGPRLRQRAGTLSLGILLIAVSASTFRQGGFSIDPRAAELLALSRYGVLERGWVFQLITNAFVHVNLFHLASNLLVLMLLSAYEWRVGVRRYFAVFMSAAVISSVIDLALMPGDSLSMGASGGICGLAAAYFLDHRDLSRKEWILGALFVLALVGAYSFMGVDERALDGASVNWIAHLSGAAVGALYVRVFRGEHVEGT